jgi:hypothetical protein
MYIVRSWYKPSAGHSECVCKTDQAGSPLFLNCRRTVVGLVRRPGSHNDLEKCQRRENVPGYTYTMVYGNSGSRNDS